MGSCKHRIAQIDLFLDKELPPTEEAQLLKHLEECPECVERMREHERMDIAIAEELDARLTLPDDDRLKAQAMERAVQGSRWISFRRRLKKVTIATAASLASIVILALVLGRFYFHRTFSYELSEVVLRCSDGIEISDKAGDWRPLLAGSRLDKAAGIQTPAGERSFMSFDGIRLLTDDRAELETVGRRAISLKSGETYVESAEKKRKPVSIAMGKASLLSNGSVLRIARHGDSCSIGIASGTADLTMPDGMTHRLAEGYTATWKEKGTDLDVSQEEVVDPFARMRISAIERTKQRFKEVLSRYFPDWQMAGYQKERRHFRGMIDMLSDPVEMYRFASYSPTSPLQLVRDWSGAAGEYYENLFMPGNRSISIGRQKVVTLPPGMAPAFPGWSYDGTMITFIETRPGATTGRVKVVSLNDLDNPWDISQGFRVRSFAGPGWTPDSRHVVFQVETGPRWEDNGEATHDFPLKIAPIDPTEGPVRDYNPPFTDIPLPRRFSLPVGKNTSPNFHKLPWGDALIVSNWGNLAYVPIEEDGQQIEGAPGLFLTDFNPRRCFVTGGGVSPSGNIMNFTAAVDFDFSHMKGYLLYDAEDILDGFAPPPRSLKDPRIRPIAPTENMQFTAGLTFDESLAIFHEDVNHAFDIMWPTRMSDWDFDIFYASALRDGPPKPIQIHLPGSQMFLTSSPEGNRIAYCNYTRTKSELRVVSFDIEADMDMDLGGVLIDNSGTNLIVPPGTLEENFGVTISTPFTIGEEAELTEGDNTFFAMRLLDAKGLDKPQFIEPMTLTIRYTDDEVEGLDEDMLDIYYYDESDPDNPTWVSLGGTVYPEYNEITIEIQHFSKFAVGGRKPADINTK
jgi:ferric-dicitrate binding protein FerR (iron transport regulator)